MVFSESPFHYGTPSLPHCLLQLPLHNCNRQKLAQYNDLLQLQDPNTQLTRHFASLFYFSYASIKCSSFWFPIPSFLVLTALRIQTAGLSELMFLSSSLPSSLSSSVCSLPIAE